MVLAAGRAGGLIVVVEGSALALGAARRNAILVAARVGRRRRSRWRAEANKCGIDVQSSEVLVWLDGVGEHRYGVRATCGLECIILADQKNRGVLGCALRVHDGRIWLTKGKYRIESEVVGLPERALKKFLAALATQANGHRIVLVLISAGARLVQVWSVL